MSPLSIIAFLLDVLVRPAPHNSIHQMLRSVGRRTDRWINLFDSNDTQSEARPSAAVQEATDGDPAEPDHP